MKIFLSYAIEDAEPARVIYDRLRADNHTIFNWRAPENEGERFIRATEAAIREADHFLALVSPHFLTSYWCQEERELALRYEHERAGGAQFIHVLQLSAVDHGEAGYLGNRGWRDISRPEMVGPALDALLALINQGAPVIPSPRSPGESMVAQDAQNGEPVFRNREDELEKVLRGLTNAAGPHFWLVIGPPQLGKTWFVDRIRKDETLAEPGWVINRVDLREQPSAARTDPDLLLGLMFGRSLSAVSNQTLLDIAIGINRSGRPHLYIVDSAELLDARAANRLRQHLQPIYRHVLEGGPANSRLAVIIASRRDDGWGGLNPDPRLSGMSLTEFTVDVVQKALRDMAQQTGRVYGEATYWRYAAQAHSLTEGLPALLARCLQWIVDQAWTDLDRMERPDIFRELAGPYIESDLLTNESLFPGDFSQGDGHLLALRSAYRLLAPYRLFTLSHLSHHLERDPDLTDTLGRLGWSVTDLWQAIIGTSLLVRPATGPWQRIHPAVRRLLYRYFYQSGGGTPGALPAGVETQREAGTFIRSWTQNQVGPQQVVGLVEALWHDANVLVAGSPEEASDGLIAFARQLSEDLRPSAALSLEELRDYAVELMRGDIEFQRAIGHIAGLFDRLVDIVQSP